MFKIFWTIVKLLNFLKGNSYLKFENQDDKYSLLFKFYNIKTLRNCDNKFCITDNNCK
jgi:hypothetical protein